MIVILAVALIVVGPDKLPELARSLAKGLGELKKTVNQVKENLSEETKVISSVQEDLQKSAGKLADNLLDSETKIWRPEDEVAGDKNIDESEVIDLQPLEERPWEKDAQAGPEKKEEENAADDTADVKADASAHGSPDSPDNSADSSNKDTPSPAA